MRSFDLGLSPIVVGLIWVAVCVVIGYLVL
jgi:hypothetical protein